MQKTKILLYDLEVSRTIAEGYGSRWDFKVVKFKRPQLLMCFSYKWLGEKKTHFVSRHDFKTYRELVQALHDILSQADVTVAHNGASFDDKMANRFFLMERMNPPRPRKAVDTRREAKRHFRFESNSLNDLGEFLGLGSKENITYADLEDEYMMDKCSKRVERLMKRYNNQDVVLLEKIYNVMLPYMKSHPNLNDIYQVHGACPKCLSTDLKKEGTHARANGRVQSWRCNDCGGWCNDSSIIKPGGRKVHG